MWVIASIPFWLIGIWLLLGSFMSIEWKKPTSDAEVKRILCGLIGSGILFVIAAKVAS